MGLGGSVWVHIEGIRRATVDLEVDNPKYEEYMEHLSLKMASRFWEDSEKYKVQKRSTRLGSGYGARVPKSLVRPIGIF